MRSLPHVDRVAVDERAATLGRRVRVFGATITLPDARMAVLQVGLATVDVALTAAVFFALLPAAPGLGFLRFLGVYVSCFTAGTST